MAAIHTNTSSVQLQFELVRVVSVQALFLGNSYELACNATYLYNT